MGKRRENSSIAALGVYTSLTLRVDPYAELKRIV